MRTPQEWMFLKLRKYCKYCRAEYTQINAACFPGISGKGKWVRTCNITHQDWFGQYFDVPFFIVLLNYIILFHNTFNLNSTLQKTSLGCENPPLVLKCWLKCAWWKTSIPTLHTHTPIAPNYIYKLYTFVYFPFHKYPAF